MTKPIRVPVADISNIGSDYIVRCEFPGIEKDTLEITVENTRLTLSGRRTWSEDGQILLSEIPDGHFLRTFHLDESLSTADIVAEFRNGLLVLRIPKQKQERKTIPITEE
jgi:HSP20 family protein